MKNLFEENHEPIKGKIPLPERMRPEKIEDIIGQEHLLGKKGVLNKFISSGFIPSMIFWGPPGSGKTTLALVLANEINSKFIRASAIEIGVKDLREIINKAEYDKARGKETILFIDEIHRFNKSQQDSLLHAVEKGFVTLIGATTENPSFEVNSALLSRCQVYTLKQLERKDLESLILKTLELDTELSKRDIDIVDMDFLIDISGGDARAALNALELTTNLKKSKKIKLFRKDFEQALQQKFARYDKKGESHYDTISAFIKSMRGSDPDAAIYWLAKMLDAGEDPKFVARRMVIFASEDIGNADPTALILATSVFDAVNQIGMPECRINLAQGVTYLASAAKSNAAYKAINSAMRDISKGSDISIPLHLRNAPTKLMKQEGYGKNYKYPHDHPGNFVKENYFPENHSPKKYYDPTSNGREKVLKERLDSMWSNRMTSDE